MTSGTTSRQRRIRRISLVVAILQIASGVAGVVASTTMKNITEEVNSTVARVGTLLNQGIETLTQDEMSIPGRINQAQGAKRVLATLPPPTTVLFVYCVVTLLGLILLTGVILMKRGSKNGTLIMHGWAVLVLLWTLVPFTGHYESLAVLRFFFVEVHFALGIVCTIGALFVQLFWPIWLLCLLRPSQKP